MYKLYWAKGSGAMAPQALFEEIGVEYEKIVIDFDKDEHKSDAFLSVNPMGQIPALVLPDGTLMTETAAMLVQIVDRHPEAKLAPPASSGERARFLRWLFSWVRTSIPRFCASTTPIGFRPIRVLLTASRPPLRRAWMKNLGFSTTL